ncbi:Thioesterase/thiol ester dehydrase-isomerase [Conidiobolus coronatus NRRL 28638]|uniref:Thioesterase/thiol ester dehydrase-isomerase n=1 Tax=Conidiobolus coronatus (strain ATCC 28846 / CBS 209.66 / NRRL 28638) TaxID=796925 RepID=A0A137P859_CONC2|nr:Thioesterase/thiol ester dehydrase-isomerase [Conidiobolus coronatus NRRL 28638]|eukprot:KXN71197.1 Thioesterase/thiol ester dehydrase-isomerase [Conidiobolus coronatus NRRL 28638]
MNKGFVIRKNNTNSEIITRFYKEIRDELDKFPSVITIPVQWGLQDVNQHLNNVNWLRFCESGRSDYIAILSLYMEPKKFFEMVGAKSKGLIVKRVSIDYFFQVSYPDSLTVATKVTSLESNKFKFVTNLYSLANNKLVGICEATFVGYDFKAGKKCDFEPTLFEALTQMENDPKEAQELALNLPTRTYSNL